MRIINIEGIENIGKTTLINKIKEIYPSDKYNVEYVKFPSEDCTGIMNNAFNRIKHYNEYIEKLLFECDVNYDGNNGHINDTIIDRLSIVHDYIGNIRDIYREISELNVEEQLSWFVKSYKNNNPMTYYICDRSLLSTFYTNFVQYELYSLIYYKWEYVLEKICNFIDNINYPIENLSLDNIIKILFKYNNVNVSSFKKLYTTQIKLFLENEFNEFSYNKCMVNFDKFVYNCINNMRNTLYNFIDDDTQILDSLPMLYLDSVDTYVLVLHNNKPQYTKKALKNDNTGKEDYKNILDDSSSIIYDLNTQNICNIIDRYDRLLTSKYFGKLIKFQVDYFSYLNSEYIRFTSNNLAKALCKFYKFTVKENEIKEDESKCCKCGNKCSTCSCNSDHEKVRDVKNENKMKTDHTKNSVKTVVRRSMNVRIESED